MAQARNGGRGRGGFKYGLCKELEGHVFEYGGHGAADKMRVTMEKIQQFVGLKFGKDVPTNSRIEPRWFAHRLNTPLLQRQGMW